LRTKRNVQYKYIISFPRVCNTSLSGRHQLVIIKLLYSIFSSLAVFVYQGKTQIHCINISVGNSFCFESSSFPEFSWDTNQQQTGGGDVTATV